jgi:hypothetical protein
MQPLGDLCSSCIEGKLRMQLLGMLHENLGHEMRSMTVDSITIYSNTALKYITESVHSSVHKACHQILHFSVSGRMGGVKATESKNRAFEELISMINMQIV